MDTPSLKAAVAKMEAARTEAWTAYQAAIQALVNKYGVMLATGHCSDMWQAKKPRAKEWVYDSSSKHAEFFEELDELDQLAEEWGLGPSNMEMFKPEARVKEQP